MKVVLFIMATATMLISYQNCAKSPESVDNNKPIIEPQEDDVTAAAVDIILED